MTTQYPNGIDGDPQIPLSSDNITPVKSIVVNTLRGAIFAIEAELGIQPSREYDNVRQRLDAMQSVLNALQAAGGGGNANLTTLPPADITKSVALVGTVQLAALSDHKHNVVTSSASSVGATNSEGNSTALARSDHTHATIDLHITSQVQGSILYFNGTNWVQLSPSTDGFTLTTHGAGANPTWTAATSGALSNNSPLDVTKSTALPGTSTLASRDDHKHDILTATTLSIANANAEGTATSLARSDHLHALAGTVGGNLSGTLPNPSVVDLTITGEVQGSVLYYNGTHWVVLNPSSDGYVLTTHSTGQNPSWTALGDGIALAVVPPLDVDKNISAVGTSARAAREDHHHSAVTASGISIGATNSEGTATSLARSDHSHKVTDLSITSQTQGSLIYFNGTNWVVLPPSTTGNILTTNGVGANPSWNVGLSLANTTPINVDRAAATAGVATTASRSDHHHSSNTSAAISIGTANTEGVATTLARSDHTHLVSSFNISGQAIGDLLVFNGTNWVVLAPSTTGLILTANGVGAVPSWQIAASGVTLATTAPADVDTAAAVVGVGTTAARSDHKHLVSTSSAVSIGATNAIGTALSLARSDHQHQVVDLKMTSQVQGSTLYFNGTNWVVLAPGTSGFVLQSGGVAANPSWVATTALTSVAPVNVDGTAAAVGTATTAARQDHHHSVNFGTPISIGATNAQGTATTLARSDHTHSVTDLAITGETHGDIIFFNGTNWVRLAAGQDGYVLTTHGTVANPTWNIVSGGGGSPVSSVFARVGAVVAVSGDYAASLITNDSSVAGANVKLALNTLQASLSGLVTGVSSVFGRTGAVIAVTNDYTSTQITNSSGVAGTAVTGALNTLQAAIASLITGVSSVYGRTGAVVAATNDYNSTQITNSSGVTGVGVTGALNTLNTTISGLVTGVSSVFGRTGAIVAVAGDYVASKINNDSLVSGTHVSDALNTLNARATGVSSVFGRTGAVIAVTNDYNSTQIQNFSFATGSSVTSVLNNLQLEFPNGFYSESTNFTLSTAFLGKLGLMNAANITVTVPTLASSGIVQGSMFSLLLYGSGATLSSIVAAGGVTVHVPTFFPTERYSRYNLECIGPDEWKVRAIPFNLTSNNIINASAVSGTEVSDALNTLNTHSFLGDVNLSYLGNPGGSTDDAFWTFTTNKWADPANVDQGAFIDFFLGPVPNNAILNSITISWVPKTGHGGLPSIMPKFQLWGLSLSGPLLLASVSDPSSLVSIYEVPHDITIISGGTISYPVSSNWVRFLGEAGTNRIVGGFISAVKMNLS